MRCECECSESEHMFIPHRTRYWKPEHMRGVVMQRDCYWCGEVKRKKDMTTIKEGPIVWHFCDLQCASKWAKHRLKREWRKYLRMTPHERLDLPISQIPREDGPEPATGSE